MDVKLSTCRLKFLGAGSSLYPLDALKLACVDFSTRGLVEETFEVWRKWSIVWKNWNSRGDCGV